MNWLVKQEPEDYPFARLQVEKITAWTGVRNFQARNNLRAMAKGEMVLYYHSGSAREIVGLCKVVRTSYPDPTATEGDWVCVDLQAVRALPSPVTLARIKADPQLADLPLIRQSRLSVMPLDQETFRYLLKLGGL
ncbi:MAG: EVE domain-containing protein [Verrucomicrobiia bacterium]